MDLHTAIWIYKLYNRFTNHAEKFLNKMLRFTNPHFALRIQLTDL